MKHITKLRLGHAVIRRAITGVSRPWVVVWFVTGRCTAHCAYCQWKNIREMSELGNTEARRLIEQIADAGVIMLSFTGGEPLVRDDMGDLIRFSNRRNIACKLNSNGDLIPGRIKELKTLELLQISLDGPADMNDDFRGPGNAAVVERAVESALSEGIPTQLVGCITAQNALQMTNVVEYASRLGVKISLQPLVVRSMPESVRSVVVPSRQALDTALSTLLDISKSCGRIRGGLGNSTGEIQFYRDRLRHPYSACPCPIVTAAIMPDGQMTFCGIPPTAMFVSATELGFAEAFKSLTAPACDGADCCVGRLRLSRAARFRLY